MTTPAISVAGLTHRYGSTTALDNLSLTVEPGQIFAILGPNGGGKTTLFKILATLLKPTSGSAALFGHDVLRQSQQARTQLGVVFQAPSLDIKLTARENLMHQGHLYGLSGSDLRQRIDKQLQNVSLTDRADDRVEQFSGGMRRRVELAKAMLHDPPLLLLDEPDTGLDPGARRDLWTHLERLRNEQGSTIALTTHLMDQAQRSDHVAIIDHGKLVAVDTPGQLKNLIRGDVITVEPRQIDPSELCRLIHEHLGPAWPDGTQPTLIDNSIRFEKHDGPALVAQLGHAFGDHIAGISVGRPTLEDVFLHLTGRRFE